MITGGDAYVPVETALSYYNPRRYSYRLELRRHMGD